MNDEFSPNERARARAYHRPLYLALLADVVGTTASKTTALRARTNPVEWKRSWRVVKDDERGRSITAGNCPRRGRANAWARLGPFLGPAFAAQCARSGRQPGS